MPNPSVVQSAVASTNASNAPTPTFASAVTAGNTLYAIVLAAANNLITTTGANGWTKIGATDSKPSGGAVFIYSRTALSGDGVTPPTIQPNFQNFSATTCMWEVADDGGLDTSIASAQMTSAGGTTGSMTTGAANELALGAAGSFFASNAPPFTAGGWGSADHAAAGSPLTLMYHQSVAASGASVSATIGAASSGLDIYYALLLIKPTGGGPVTGSGGIGTANLTAPAGHGLVPGVGPLGTITLTAPTGTAGSSSTGAGGLGTVTVTAPAGSATEGARGAGPIGTITLSPPSFTLARDTQGMLLIPFMASADARASQEALASLARNTVNARTTWMAQLVLAKGGETPLTPELLPLMDQGRDPVQRLRLVNMYVEPTPQGPGPSARYQRGGLYNIVTRGGGPIRAVKQHAGFLYVLSGFGVWRDSTQIGAITGDINAYAKFADSENQVCLLADGSCFTCDDPSNGPGTVVRITSSSLPPRVSDIAFSAGRFIYLHDDNSGMFSWSELNDCTAIGGLNFATAEVDSDPLVGVGVLADNVAFFGTRTTEWWFPNADPDAPFQRSLGKMYTRGLAARRSISICDNTIVFLGNDRIVYRSESVPMRISNYWVEDYLRRCTDADLPNVSSFPVTFGGHTFYVVTIPKQGTWACDLSQNNSWAEWKSWGRDRFRGFTADFNVVGDFYSGNLMGFDGGTNTDLGDPLERIVATFQPVKGGMMQNFNIALLCTRGVGLATDGYGKDPVVELRIADHEGRDFGPWMTAPLGEQGVRTEGTKAVWRQLGGIRAPGRVFEFRCTDPVFFAPFMVKINEVAP